jgi:hypothetical protein
MPRLRRTLVEQRRDDFGEPVAQLRVRELPSAVECLVGLADGQFIVDDVCTDRGQDLAQLGLCPARAEHSRAGAYHAHGFAAHAVVRPGPEAQSSAFLSAPGTELLYSGVAMITASAVAINCRNDAAVVSRSSL